jgi:hypothetical protein
MKTNRIFALTTKIIIICILLSGVASANPPIVLEGTVTIDGNPAPAGTVIKAMCGEDVVGTTTVDNAGYYSDTRDNKLGISSVSDCDSLTLYVNNIKTKELDVSSMNAGDIVTVVLQATTSTSSSSEPTKTTTSGGGGGGFSSAPVEETPSEEEVEEIPEEEEIMTSVEDTVEEVTEKEESVPVEETEAQSADFPTVVGVGSMLVAAGILIRKKKE